MMLPLGAGFDEMVNEALLPSVTAEPPAMVSTGVPPPPSLALMVRVWMSGSLRAYCVLLRIVTVMVSAPSPALSSMMAMGMLTEVVPALTVIVRLVPVPPLTV